MIKRHPLQDEAFGLALQHIGTREIPGSEDNPVIVGWFEEVGHSWVKDDETAWCAAFLGAMLERAGLASTKQLTARSYLTWGEAVPFDKAQRGDILVFWRNDPDGWQGHVGFFVDRDASGDLYVLGGNQANEVNTAKYPAHRLLGVRRMPASARLSIITQIINFIRRLFDV